MLNELVYEWALNRPSVTHEDVAVALQVPRRHALHALVELARLGHCRQRVRKWINRDGAPRRASTFVCNPKRPPFVPRDALISRWQVAR